MTTQQSMIVVTYGVGLAVLIIAGIVSTVKAIRTTSGVRTSYRVSKIIHIIILTIIVAGALMYIASVDYHAG